MASEKELAILRILLDESDLHGLEIARRSYGGICRGTLYSTLKRMERKGLVRSRQEVKVERVPGVRRRFYAVTDEGRGCV